MTFAYRPAFLTAGWIGSLAGLLVLLCHALLRRATCTDREESR
jgi:hypothetical protein